MISYVLFLVGSRQKYISHVRFHRRCVAASPVVTALRSVQRLLFFPSAIPVTPSSTYFLRIMVERRSAPAGLLGAPVESAFISNLKFHAHSGPLFPVVRVSTNDMLTFLAADEWRHSYITTFQQYDCTPLEWSTVSKSHLLYT
jgi:hypothetical protein